MTPTHPGFDPARDDGTDNGKGDGRRDDPFAAARAVMLEQQLRSRGVRDPRVLAAMAEVPREAFVLRRHRDLAYADEALPIDHGQTISQPLMVGLMTQLLAPVPGQRVLEIGTGSGYQAAVLAALGCRVTSVERIPALAEAARDRLEALGYGSGQVSGRDGGKRGGLGGPGSGLGGPGSGLGGLSGGLGGPGSGLGGLGGPGSGLGDLGGLGAGEDGGQAGRYGVEVRIGDGSTGVPDGGPWPRILVAAAAPDVPDALTAQLADGGRLVIPVGPRYEQELVLVERDGDRLRTTNHGACVFVPLVGEGGYH